ncbi:hypothetical protein [Glycomyces paridis]|uniref:hypothetical protein n=1 Tax=Glycomyces paridis TaxID=2126555 RepID=UPI00195C3211|nr:hypothetical protein [Glycomyces paridis]
MALSERGAGGARRPRDLAARGGNAEAIGAACRVRQAAPRLLAALITALLAAVAPPAPAAAQEACAGVTVVVDFGALAAPATGCADDPADGLDALVRAGFTVTEVASIRGMVCRIDDLPEADCGGAPPADAYWSYWHAAPGDDAWTYAMVGGAVSTPDPGDLEGWAFGDGKTPPAVAPADAVAAPADAEEGNASSSWTWLLAVAALAVIASLVLWRRRRRPRT